MTSNDWPAALAEHEAEVIGSEEGAALLAAMAAPGDPVPYSPQRTLWVALVIAALLGLGFVGSIVVGAGIALLMAMVL